MCAPSSNPIPRTGERGASVVLFALLCLTVLIPALGLGIDYSFLFLARMRMISAADAAALAGCRSLNVGQDFASQKANAQNVALQYFDANFPANFLGATAITRTADAEQSQSLYRTVQVNAQANIPTTFLAVFGQPYLTLSATATTSRRNVAIMLVLDRSGSMVTVCGTLRQDAINFVNGFADGLDSMGLATLSSTAEVDVALNSTFKSNITNAIGNLQCNNGTNTAEALYLANQQLQNAPSGTMRVIVLFTDGAPEAYSSHFFGTGSCAQDIPAGIDGIIFTEGGIGRTTQQPINDTSAQPWFYSSHCGVTNYPGLASYYAYIPESDLWGNSASLVPYQPLARDGLGRITITASNATAAAYNGATYAANLARISGARLYTIGLASNGADGTWLTNIANDPSGPSYNSAQPAGKYANAANASDLANAFNAIKSEILRISQ